MDKPGTPKDFARNVRAARAARAERERIRKVAPQTRLAYRSQTEVK